MYPEPKAKYPGQDRAEKLCRASGGVAPPAEQRGRQMLRNASKVEPYLQKAGFPSMKSADMQEAQQVSNAVPRRKE